jgi:DNA-binding transcriptional ArsR family regulator
MSKKLYQPQNHSNAANIPNWLIQIPIQLLSFGAKLVYARLCKWVGANGRAHRSSKQLSIEIGISQRGIERHLKELREAELIGTYQLDPGGMNNFEFYDHEWMHTQIADEVIIPHFEHNYAEVL